MTTRNFKVVMKQSRDSSDDYKFPVTANETFREKTDVFMELMPVIGSDSPRTQTKLFFFFFNNLLFCAMTVM